MVTTQNGVLITDTKASEKITSLITNPQHCNDVSRLSAKYQTSSLESFHNVVIHFAPKSVAFSYLRMEHRFKKTKKQLRVLFLVLIHTFHITFSMISLVDPTHVR